MTALYKSWTSSLILSVLCLASAAHGQAPGAAARPEAPAADLPLPKELPPLGKDRPLPVPQIKQIKTPQGLQVWLVRRAGVPKISAVLAVRGGIAADAPGQEGTSELLAEVLKNGTARRSAKQIAEDMQAIGGDIGTEASDDAIYVSVQALSSGAAQMIEILADVARNASFPQQEVDLAKANALENLAVKESTPGFLGRKAFARAVFGDHPYHVVAPTREAIQAVLSEGLLQEFQRRFRPQAGLLVVVGEMDLGAVQRAILSGFGGWQAAGPAVQATPPPIPAAGPGRILVVNRPGSVQSLLMVGRMTVRATDPQHYPLLVANTIFGGSFGSRLVKNIREQKGYTYSPQADAGTMQMGGLLRVRADVRNEVTGPTLKEIFAEMERMGTTVPTAEELQRAKRYQGGLYLLRNQIQQAVAGTLATNWVNGLGPEALGAFVPKVNAVSAEQVRKIGQTIYLPRTQTVVVVGDEPKIKAELVPFGEVAPASP